MIYFIQRTQGVSVVKYIGIDLGGTNIAVGICDEYGNILHKRSVRTDTCKPFPALLDDISDCVYTLLDDCGEGIHGMGAVGLGTPSCIDPRTSLLVNANNLGWRNVPLYAEMKKRFDIPVFIQNDAACAALGEMYKGAAKSYENVIMITLGTGVGGGVIMNGRLWNGCDSMGAEFGHTKLVYGGLRCSCGQRGCLEQYASATALIRQYSESTGRIIESAKEIFDIAHKGDIKALEVIDTFTDHLSAGISSFIAVFRPDIVIIGGGLCAQDKLLIKPLREKLYRDTFAAQEIGIPGVMAAKLGNDAGIIGAAMLCMHGGEK